MSCTQKRFLDRDPYPRTSCTQTLHLAASGACPWCRPLPIHSQLRQDPCPRSQVSRAVHGREGLSGSPLDRSKSAISLSSCRRSSPSRVRGRTSARPPNPASQYRRNRCRLGPRLCIPGESAPRRWHARKYRLCRGCGEGDFGVLSHHVLALRRIFRRLAPGSGKANTSRHQKQKKAFSSCSARLP